MKNYTYNGEQASFALRTPAGRLFLQKGLIVAVALAIHEAASQNPIVKALVKTGEITVTDQFKPAQVDTVKSDTEIAAAKAAEDAQRAADEAKAKTVQDPSAIRDPNPVIHPINGGTVIDTPVVTELTNNPDALNGADGQPELVATPSAELVDKPKLTIPQIKKLLDEAGIEYAAHAKRDELEALLPKPKQD